MAKDSLRPVAMECEQEAVYPSFQMVLFSMTSNDP